MFDWTPSTVRRLVAAVALALAVLPFTSGGGFFHAAFNVYNAEAAADGTAFTDHGRSHDDSAPDERQTGHLNEHNAADHSHESTAPAVSLAWQEIRATRAWRRSAIGWGETFLKGQVVVEAVCREPVSAFIA